MRSGIEDRESGIGNGRGRGPREAAVKSVRTRAWYAETQERKNSRMGVVARRWANRARGGAGKVRKKSPLGWFCEELVEILYKALPFLTPSAR
jgi:hypothetical protein